MGRPKYIYMKSKLGNNDELRVWEENNKKENAPSKEDSDRIYNMVDKIESLKPKPEEDLQLSDGRFMSNKYKNMKTEIGGKKQDQGSESEWSEFPDKKPHQGESSAVHQKKEPTKSTGTQTEDDSYVGSKIKAIKRFMAKA